MDWLDFDLDLFELDGSVEFGSSRDNPNFNYKKKEKKLMSILQVEKSIPISVPHFHLYNFFEKYNLVACANFTLLNACPDFIKKLSNFKYNNDHKYINYYLQKVYNLTQLFPHGNLR